MYVELCRCSRIGGKPRDRAKWDIIMGKEIREYNHAAWRYTILFWSVGHNATQTRSGVVITLAFLLEAI